MLYAGDARVLLVCLRRSRTLRSHRSAILIVWAPSLHDTVHGKFLTMQTVRRLYELSTEDEALGLLAYVARLIKAPEVPAYPRRQAHSRHTYLNVFLYCDTNSGLASETPCGALGCCVKSRHCAQRSTVGLLSKCVPLHHAGIERISDVIFAADREICWLVSTAWNRGCRHVKFLKPCEAVRFMGAALSLMDFCEDFKERQEVLLPSSRA